MKHEQKEALAALLQFCANHPKFLGAADYPAQAVETLGQFLQQEQAAAESVEFA